MEEAPPAEPAEEPAPAAEEPAPAAEPEPEAAVEEEETEESKKRSLHAAIFGDDSEGSSSRCASASRAARLAASIAARTRPKQNAMGHDVSNMRGSSLKSSNRVVQSIDLWLVSQPHFARPLRKASPDRVELIDRRGLSRLRLRDRPQLRLRANKLPSPNHCERRDFWLVF